MYHRIYVCAQSLQSCPVLWDPMDYNLPGSSVYGILQARILEWVAMHFSRGSSRSRDHIQVFCFSCTASGFFLPMSHLGSLYRTYFCCWCFSVTKLCPTLCDPIDYGTPGLPVPHHLLEFAQVHVNLIGEAIQPSHLLSPLLLLPSFFPSIRVFSSELALHIRWSKYWGFSFSISSSNEYLELIPYRIGWFDLLAVQGTLKSTLLHHNSKASVLWCSDFFMVQLSHLHMTTGKIIGLPIWTFVPKVPDF